MLSGADLGGTPNGIALSPDGKWMYLSTAGRQMRRYAVNPDGTLGAFTVFTEGVGIGDGQKTDTAGNVYSSSGAGPGIIRITSPEGKLLGTINLPIYGGEPKRQICATNEAFGGSGWQDAVHRRLRCRLHDPAEDARDRSGVHREQVLRPHLINAAILDVHLDICRSSCPPSHTTSSYRARRKRCS